MDTSDKRNMETSDKQNMVTSDKRNMETSDMSKKKMLCIFGSGLIALLFLQREVSKFPAEVKQ